MSGEAGGADPTVLLLRFVDRFDRGEYWLAHEELEQLWLERREDFFKGLIHLAAALVHVERGNPRGAAAKARSGLEHIETAQADDFAGFDVPRLRARARALVEHLQELAAGDVDSFDERLRLRLRPLFDAEVPEGIAEAQDLPYRVRRYGQGYRLGRDPGERD